MAMSENHPYRSLQVPSETPFELKPSPGKGWGAFATRRIERGSLILREKPIFVIRKPHAEITEEDVWTAFQQLTPSEKQQFLCLRDKASRPFTRMTETCAENSFALSASPSPLPPDPPIHGLFPLHSRLNHSCIPNSKVPLPTTGEETIASFATKDILPSEEITFCYNSDFEARTARDRHAALRFVCDCKACQLGTPFQRLSDVRRTLVRGLQYLTLGVDLDGQRQQGSSAYRPLICDAELKNAAEELAIPLSSRLIYNLLVMYLLEEEGLLDHFMRERVEPGILQTASLLETESNARIARLAVARESCLGRLCVAFRLWGREDAADHAVAVMLRGLHGLSVNV